MRSVFFAASFVCFCTLVFSQQKDARKLWTQPMGADTQWLFTSREGTLIVATREQFIQEPDSIHTADTLQITKLQGVDPSNGHVKWTFKSIVPLLIPYADTIPKLPYISLRDVSLTIIDPRDGRVVFEALASGITRIYNYGFLYQSGHLWVDGIFGGIRSLNLIDLATGKMLWNRYDYFSPPDRSKLNKVKNFATRGAVQPRLLSEPIDDDNGNIIFASGDGLYFNYFFKIEIGKGDVIWKTEAPDPNKDNLVRFETDTSYFRLIPGSHRFFFARSNWMTSCSYDNGVALWKAPVKTHGKVAQVLYTGDSLAAVVENSDLGASHLNFININDGAYTLPEHFKLKGEIQHVQAVNSKVLYVTTQGASIIDPDLKEHVNISCKALAVDGGSKVYVFCKQDHKLYEIDKANATSRVLNREAVDFKGLDNPDRIGLHKEGVILYSNKNIAFISFDGTRRYNYQFSVLFNLPAKGVTLDEIKTTFAVDTKTGLLFFAYNNVNGVTALDLQK